MPTLAENRRARHDYEILEKFEAGLVLSGAEVKSVKLGRLNLQGSYVLARGLELWLVGAQIAPYGPAGPQQSGYDPKSDRKLLLKRQQLGYLVGRLTQDRLTLVPLSAYTAHRFVKLEIGLARGRTRYDKRAAMRKREIDRSIRRTLHR